MKEEKAVLFTGLLFHDEIYLNEARQRLLNLFGKILFESPTFDWDYSEYYRAELGWPIKRSFIFFDGLINSETLPDIKLLTREIERSLSKDGRRAINIDPGYLTLSKVVLASTKNYSHRIYMGKGIFAEVTLIFRNKRYRPHLFTYRDYASDSYIDIFMKARQLLINTTQPYSLEHTSG